MRVLVIEDDSSIRELYKAVFESCGHEVIVVGTFSEAMRTLDCPGFDAAVTDDHMPTWPGGPILSWGLDVCRSCKGAGLRVALVCGDEKTVDEAKHQGFEAFVKPVRMERLLALVGEDEDARV